MKVEAWVTLINQFKVFVCVSNNHADVVDQLLIQEKTSLHSDLLIRPPSGIKDWGQGASILYIVQVP